MEQISAKAIQRGKKAKDGGLTIREYFAGLAMAALSNGSKSPEQVVNEAVLLADALLHQLTKD